MYPCTLDRAFTRATEKRSTVNIPLKMDDACHDPVCTRSIYLLLFRRSNGALVSSISRQQSFGNWSRLSNMIHANHIMNQSIVFPCFVLTERILVSFIRWTNFYMSEISLTYTTCSIGRLISFGNCFHTPRKLFFII